MTEKTYQRFSLAHRLEHIIALTSFTILAITGLPQKYPSAGWADAMINIMGGIEMTRQIHHIAAIVLMLETVYHLVAIGYRVLVQRVRFTMLPGVRDLNDAIGTFIYNIGLRKEKPQGGRYTYEEKAEYWAFIWGTIIMVITGFMMWNPIATANFFPGEFIPAAKAAHGGEALLAVLAIIVWHLYGVHLKHFNKSMWTGKMTETEMAHDHPLELSEIKAGTAHIMADEPTIQKRQQVYVPVAGVFAVALIFGVYQFVNFEKTAIETVQPRAAIVPAFSPLQPTPLPTRRPTQTPVALKAVWEGNLSTVFQQKCIECHGGLAGLDFASYATTMKGGSNGAVIVPKDAEKSKIITKMSGAHPGKFSDAELKVLKDWIAAGAPEK
ncbi:MAG: cytochrome b/b6 domain-containing protein [Chloroflexota bacterium]